ncbi:D-alanyl-D-alanine dipeptidase [Synechococcales cyanobacterium C]|uniref:D-alanyl-D-alanine dipeptidase n=1 Tax=Petrachloros mirabilis ULC683 TaxID=2781853 RepID=A0A8K1ZYK6_9CYAN|nr:M15 family metallopeptidase [Petrachloros mirabilis]NCJ07680.1 D-alanyl-D-alanine dipeptidase [Petrachloros mirabilis ULC683]
MPKPSKPYLQIPIVECGDPLVPIPLSTFARQTPHAYAALGAPYGQASPFWVRSQVLQALIEAQAHLQLTHPHWQLLIFDAYRPIAVQQFMVDYTFAQVLQARHLQMESLSDIEQQNIWDQVYQLWAAPSLDPQTPPPHSTGAAVDVTLWDAQAQQSIDMGSEIDELSARSHPSHFAYLAKDPHIEASARTAAQQANTHRHILHTAMTAADFQRHPGEWWHFCLGDQMWAWLQQQAHSTTEITARYGNIEP